MKWLVTGGAGYIGSHIVQAFLDSGIQPIVLDDLSSGHRSFVPPGVEFVEGSLLDLNVISRALTGVTGVIHLAGYKYAGESVRLPLHTYEQNIVGTMNLLKAMEVQKIGNLVFSSSAAVYGTPIVSPVDEETPTNPESPYGESKLIGEWLIRDQSRATTLKFTCLRYFNVVGSGKPFLRDTSPHNLFPLLFKALSEGKTPHVNGVDFDTADGSCVRDYVHVQDVAEAHVVAATKLSSGTELREIYNLGAGRGTSVLEIMNAAREATGIEFTPEIRGRRMGDPAEIVATGQLAAKDLGWKNNFTISQMLESAWGSWVQAVGD